MRIRNVRHGLSRSREHHVWREMRYRCSSPNHPQYGDYGGRGITVCERWEESFLNFYADLGPCPPGLCLERLENDKGYFPENCAWRTRTENNRNRRGLRLLTFGGQTMCMAAWAERLGLGVGVLNNRLRKGWSVEKALTTPSLKNGARA